MTALLQIELPKDEFAHAVRVCGGMLMADKEDAKRIKADPLFEIVTPDGKTASACAWDVDGRGAVRFDVVSVVHMPTDEIAHLRTAGESQAAVDNIRQFQEGQNAAVTDGAGNSEIVMITRLSRVGKGPDGVARFSLAVASL